MRVLVADDDAVSREALAVALQRLGYDTLICEDGAQAWEALQAPDAPCLAILDWMMPAPDGVEICRRVRAQDRRPYQYVILLTSRGRVSDVTQGFEGGADDYLRKPLDVSELRNRLAAAEQRLELKNRERTSTTVDESSGLLNAAGVRDRLQRLLDESARSGAPVSVIVTQLEGVETLHDEPLRETVRRLTAQLRAHDEPGRIGRAEFVAILPACARGEALAVAERMRAALAGPLETPAGPIVAAAYAGVATADAAAALDADALLAAADAALYRSRRAT